MIKIYKDNATDSWPGSSISIKQNNDYVKEQVLWTLGV